MNDETSLLPCYDKIAFATQKEALAAAALAKHRYGSDLKVYHCRYCNQWHLSSH